MSADGGGPQRVGSAQAPALPRAEAAEAKFRGLLESAPDAIVITARDGRIVLVNRQTEAILGYAREELLGQPVELLIPERFRPGHETHRERYHANPRTRPMGAGLTLYARHKDGREIPVEISLSPMESEGELLVTSIIRDVTERQRAEEERARLLARERTARAEAERLAAERAAILGQIADGVLIADATGEIVFLNAAARRLLGVVATDPSSTGHTESAYLLTRDGQPHPPQELPLRRALQGETVVDLELGVRQPDGTFLVVQGSAAPVIGEDGARVGAVLTLRDVTAKRAVERQKEEFLANVSHDLRTPLTGIKASIGVVLANEPPNLPQPLHRLLVNIDLAADRMTDLVTDLLELARLQTGRVSLKLAPCDLRTLAERATRVVEPLAQERGQQVGVRVPAQPVLAVVDAERIERALLNLLANAHKYGRAGGVIQLHLEERGHEAVFSVIDDGPGIPLTEQEHIFERFYRPETEATRRVAGSGLGLPIARAMADLHAGRLWVESSPGAGATFRLALPRDRSNGAPGKDETDEDTRGG